MEYKMTRSVDSCAYKKHDSLPAHLILTVRQIKERIQGYGFVEVVDIFRFLDFVSGLLLEKSEYIYIRSKIEICLRCNDDGSDYFIPLREFASELDCLLS